MNNEFLTAKQVQEIFKVNRITIYRMLSDGRLRGQKVGSQWRFLRSDVEELLSCELLEDSGSMTNSGESKQGTTQLPLHCVKTIQDVVAEICGVGSITTDESGIPLTQISNCQPFCKLMMNNPEGLKGCQASWHALSSNGKHTSTFYTCHAGLQYAYAPIKVNEKFAAMYIAGQFRTEKIDQLDEERQLQMLAEKYHMDIQELRHAAAKIPVLPEASQNQMTAWLTKVANTFGQLGHERTEMVNRLRQIAVMSKID